MFNREIYEEYTPDKVKALICDTLDRMENEGFTHTEVESFKRNISAITHDSYEFRNYRTRPDIRSVL